jgi:hypothetical protein
MCRVGSTCTHVEITGISGPIAMEYTHSSMNGIYTQQHETKCFNILVVDVDA